MMAILLIVFCASVGSLLGSTAAGLAVGTGTVLAVSISALSTAYPYGYLPRRRKRP